MKYTFPSKKTSLVLFITFFLFILPFFWLSPGEMDLGGDSNRLFFYDPFSNLKAFGIYSVVPWGTGIVSSNQYFIPFLLMLTLLKYIFGSSTILIGIFNGLKLSCSFLFLFLILNELFKKGDKRDLKIYEFAAAVIASFFYTFSSSVIENMKYALVTHNQVFLNPIIFYLLLRYIITSSLKYIWVALFITFIFSTNFSLQAPPPLFAFYPISLVFLLLYNWYVLKKTIPWKGIFFGIVFFIGLHAFDLFPVISTVFDKGSEFNKRVLEGMSDQNIGLIGFNNVLSAGKVSEHILLPLSFENQRLNWSLFFIPFLSFLGLTLITKKNKTLLLVIVFFLITLFLISANITNVGVEFYRKLFLIPGFGMFRIFYGQWQWVYTFFYSLFLGLAIAQFFIRVKKKYINLIVIVVILLLLFRSQIVFNGNVIRVYHRGTENLSVVIRMDPNYEKMLSYIKNIPNDGRILHMPFTDYSYGVVGGVNRGAYVGHSMTSFLTGRGDFAGYQTIDPFSESYVKLVKEEKCEEIKKMLSLLQIRYVLYNSDEKVTDKYFTGFLYGYTNTPASGNSLSNFVKNITGTEIYQVGSYTLFEVEKENYLPHFYIASDIISYKNNNSFDKQYSKGLSFFPEKFSDENKNNRRVFLEKNECRKISNVLSCDKVFKNDQNIKLKFQKINPTKYKIEVRNATKPFLLVFQNQFSNHWKLYSFNGSLNDRNLSDFYYGNSIIELTPGEQIIDMNPFETNGLKALFDENHIEVNGYANAWLITPSELGNKKSYKFIVEMTSQKIFYYSFLTTLISLVIFLPLGLVYFMKKK